MEKKQLTLGLSVDQDTIDNIDRVCEVLRERFGVPITRSALARTCVERGLTEYEATVLQGKE